MPFTETFISEVREKKYIDTQYNTAKFLTASLGDFFGNYRTDFIPVFIKEHFFWRQVLDRRIVVDMFAGKKQPFLVFSHEIIIETTDSIYVWFLF